MPHVTKLSISDQESEQRLAAEIVYGIVRGSRFWSYDRAKNMWENHISPVFKAVLQNVTTETICKKQLIKFIYIIKLISESIY